MPKDAASPSLTGMVLRLAALLPTALFFAGAIFEVRAIDMIYYRVLPDAVMTGGELPMFGAILAAGIAAVLLKDPRWWKILLPGLLFWPLLFFPLAYFTFPTGIALAAWLVLRGTAIYEPRLPRIPFSVEHRASFLIWGFYLAAALWGFYMQRHAYRAFFLFFQDWGEYAMNYLRLGFQQGHTLRDFIAVAGHWNPLPTLMMTGMLRLAPTPETIFAINALLIYSVIPLSFYLARKLGFSPVAAGFFAFLGAINPTISNQSLSLFYGFHPINFMIPAIFGFFLCKATKNTTGAILICALSFLIQETVAIFWAGYALYLLTQRRYWTGAGLFLFSTLFFFLVSMVIMPPSLAATNYSQMFHYSQLGNTPIEVALSPFLRPAAFLKTVFQWQNFAFVFTLVLPELFLLAAFPRLAVATLPLFAGVCLQHSPDVKNIVMQYGLEITVLFLVMGIRNAARLRNGNPPRLLRFLAGAAPNKNLLPAVVAATLFGAVASYCFFGKSVWVGKYAYTAVARMPEGISAVEFLKKQIPPESRVIANQRLRGHFIFEYETEKPGSDPLRTGDAIVLDLHDTADTAAVEKIRRKMAADPRVRPITMANWYGSQLVLFRVAPPETPATPLPFLLTGVENSGMPYPADDPHFSIRLGETTAGKFRIGVGVLSVPAYDVDLVLTMRRADGSVENRRIPFAYGLKPAYATQEGDLFVCELDGPPPREFKLEIVQRPESAQSPAVP